MGMMRMEILFSGEILFLERKQFHGNQMFYRMMVVELRLGIRRKLLVLLWLLCMVV